MRFLKNHANILQLLFIILAVIIFVYVLFIPCQLGVADQGDFDRVMGTGLSLLDSDINNPHFIRFYKYIVTDYKINSVNSLFSTMSGTTMGTLITIICLVCKIFNQSIFKTQYLAISYFIIYVCAFLIILKSLNLKNHFKYLILILVILFIFFDGNYLIWFNSLYGEPMMLSTLLLFISSILYYVHYKYSLNRVDKIFPKIIFIFLSALLFIGSKLQVTLSLPFILLLIGKIIWNNRKSLSTINSLITAFLFILLITYPMIINIGSGGLSKDTQYNSVFYGILNGSKTPKQDLIDLGLNPDMYVEAGKHAYLDKSEYVKYIPRTEITEKEFYSKISNSKLAKFYLTHPKRLLKGMQYTATKAFYTSTGLGKGYMSDSKAPIFKLSRFTNWSYIRENIFPKKLWFIISVYLIIFISSIIAYMKNKHNNITKMKILLFWFLLFIGGLQFPMPFVGNGQADTGKQLFLFNFIFDIFVATMFINIIFKFIDFIKRSKNTVHRI